MEDLSLVKRAAVDLGTKESSTEITPVANPRAKPHGIVCGQLDTAYSSICNWSWVNIQSGYACSAVISRTNVIPRFVFHPSTCNWSGVLARSPNKAREKLAPTGHPQMHAEASWIVVKDRAWCAFVVHPNKDGYGVSRVQFASVWNFNVAVSLSIES